MTSNHAIKQSMWRHQHHFRTSVCVGMELALEEIGLHAKPEVVLVGLKVSGDPAFDVCIDPEGGPYRPADFVCVTARAEQLYARNPESAIMYGDADMHKERHRILHDEMRAEAVTEVLKNSSLDDRKRTFFVGQSARVGDYEVHIAVGVPTDALETVPRLHTTNRARLRVAPSFVHALIDEILDRALFALYKPDAGSSPRALGAGTPEIVRCAVERFVRSIFICAGYWFGENADILLNGVTALPYEGRAGSGRIILAKPEDPAVHVLLKLEKPVGLREARAVRKLVEASGSEADLLLGDGKVYGLGRAAPDYDKTRETVFEVSVLGRGAWDLSHCGYALLSVRDGIARLPVHSFDAPLFEDVVKRLFPDADINVLVDLARAAGQNEHGAMLVISGNAVGEAHRLSPQAWVVEPTSLCADLLRQLTAMDGAVLVDPQGKCHAIGVILDGHAAGRGDPARGSRLNNAVRYLDTERRPPAIVVVYSADGSIDVLPQLHPRVWRERVASAVQLYLELTTIRPPKTEELFEAWEDVKSLRFYLSEDQCRQVNLARDTDNEWRKRHGWVQIIENELKPNPDMNDSYWL